MNKFINFQNLTFIGILVLAYQNFQVRNKLNDITSKIEYSQFELDEIKKESVEAARYAKSANTMTFQLQSLINENKILLFFIFLNFKSFSKNIFCRLLFSS